MTDYYNVDCEEYREALSARLDGEDGPADDQQPTDLHLEYCAECALWYDNAALITRRTRTTAAVVWPDVTDAVLARVPATMPLGSTPLRVALGVVASAQCASGLFSVALPAAGDAAGYGTAAWNLALGVAFGSVVVRRVRPGALVPLLATFVGALTWGYATGVLAGTATTGETLSHAMAALGLVLVVLLGRLPPRRPGTVPPAGASALVRRSTAAGDDDHQVPRSAPTRAA